MIEVEAIRKSYGGTRGLEGFTCRIMDGEIFGLVGPNGAGKTTFIKILSTLVRPDAGQARVAGYDVTKAAPDVKRVVGYLPDQPGVYQDMRVREFLEFFADAFRVRGQQQRVAVEKALLRSGLEKRSESFVEELSFGMKQRLFLAKALLHDPKVLLLDEPATGLDPLARIDLRTQLKELNDQGMTILISSHILNDLEDICSRVALIAQGRNAADAAGQNILEVRRPTALAQLFEVEFLGDSGAAAKRAEEISGTKILESNASRLLVEIAGGPSEASAFLRQLVVAGVDVVKFDHPTATLETRYREVFGAKPA